MVHSHPQASLPLCLCVSGRDTDRRRMRVRHSPFLPFKRFLPRRRMRMKNPVPASREVRILWDDGENSARAQDDPQEMSRK